MTRILLILAGLVFRAALAAAAEDAGTDGAFDRGYWPRAVALGRAVVACPRGGEALGYSPALLSAEPRARIEALHAPGPFDASVDALALAWPTLDFGGFGLGVHRTAVGGITGRDSQGDETGEMAWEQGEAALGWGLPVAWGLRLGAAGRWGWQKLGQRSAQGAWLDWGLSWEPGQGTWLPKGIEQALAGRLTVALSERNAASTSLGLGGGQADLAHPAWRAGAALRDGLWAGRLGWLLAVQGTKEELRAWEPGVGGELAVMEALRLRAGWASAGLSLGAGLDVFGFSLDYAWEPSELQGLHRVSLGFAFGSDLPGQRRARAESHRREVEAEAAPLVKAARAEAYRLSAAERERALKDERFKAVTYAGALEAWNQGRRDEARAGFEAVAQADARYLKVSEYLALASRKEDAKREPKDELTGEMLGWYREGVRLFLQGRYQEAINSWARILEKRPQNRLAVKNIEEARRRLATQGGQP